MRDGDAKRTLESVRRVIPDLTQREQTPEPVEKVAKRKAKT